MIMDTTALTSNTPPSDIDRLKNQISQAYLPSDLTDKITTQLQRLEKMVIATGYNPQFDNQLQYLDFVSTLPFQASTQDILDLKRAGEILNKNHYGLQTVKDRILEYLSVLILNSKSGKKLHSQVLAFVGLVGCGKTSLAYSIAEGLGRKIIRIPFGGLGSVKEIRGESKVKPEAEPGSLMKMIHREGCNNPVILLDEIDRVAAEGRADVMGALVELLDPEQNFAFIDHYVDYPFDLSKALFIATANNTGNIATAVLDRLEIIEMPSYTDEEKIIIGKNYILPKALQGSGLPPGTLTLSDDIWPQVVRPLGFDAGIRSLQRTIEGVVRKVARQVVEGKPGPYQITTKNVGEYIG